MITANDFRIEIVHYSLVTSKKWYLLSYNEDKAILVSMR